MRELTMKELFLELGHSYENMSVGEVIEVSSQEVEILSRNENDQDVWRLIKSIVRKETTEAYYVPSVDLTISANHRFWTKIADGNPHWIEAIELCGRSDVHLFQNNVGWISSIIEKKNDTTDILDIEVCDTQCYYSNGILSHNTMHGDPHITPGGKSIPFSASIRIRLSSGTQVKDKVGNVIGCHVICTIKKNKLAPSGKKYFFDILFGKGIVEDEYIFDEVRGWCTEKGNECVVDGKKLVISGTGGWKELLVTDKATGEVVLTKKFTKAQFGEIRNDPQYEKYITALIDRVYTQTFEGLSTEDENDVTTEEGTE